MELRGEDVNGRFSYLDEYKPPGRFGRIMSKCPIGVAKSAGFDENHATLLGR
jgi:hypothetical protein